VQRPRSVFFNNFFIPYYFVEEFYHYLKFLFFPFFFFQEGLGVNWKKKNTLFFYHTISDQYCFDIDSFALFIILFFSVTESKSDKILFEFEGSIILENKGLLVSFESSDNI
jgi:hypothetical protein